MMLRSRLPSLPRLLPLSSRTAPASCNILHPLIARLECFSTKPQDGAYQKVCWESYLSTSRASKDLFNSIDTDSSGTISKEEVINFMDNIGRKGLREKAIKIMDQSPADAEFDLKGFQSWLVMATKTGNLKNPILKANYEAQPQLGDRKSTIKEQYSWNESTMSQSLRRMQYAVRGDVVMRADALRAQGRDITFTNVGNPHSVGQLPLTFYRQVLALCDLPAKNGVDHPDVTKLFPQDVIDRAKEMRAAVGPSGTGAYTNSQGIAEFRKDVADYIAQRDGHPAFPGDIFLTNGASSGINAVLTGLIASDHDAVMIPIPQYPIYSALITLLGGRQVGYELDESMGWAVTRGELENKYAEAKEQGLDVKALVMINPGNPTGQVYTREDIEVICKFCADHGMVLLADEVYQRNVYVPDREFLSAKKIALETPGCENMELVSFHSTSKGLIGECGRRGGYMELHHIDPYVQSQLYKLASSGLCSGVAGQIMTSLMVRPLDPSGESCDQFVEEESGIFESLGRRAKALVDGLNEIDGIECVPAQGAMYAFPKISIPQKAFEEAEANDQSPDTLYALSLLQETGICVVPASGFGQAKGRVGFRTTFLPPEDKLMVAIDEFARHHKIFCEKYA